MRTVLELDREDIVELISEKYEVAPVSVEVLSNCDVVVRIDVTYKDKEHEKFPRIRVK